MAFVKYEVPGVSALSPFSALIGGTEIIFHPGLNEIADDVAAEIEALTSAEWPPRFALHFDTNTPIPIVESPPADDPPPPNTNQNGFMGEIPDIESMNADDAIAAINKIGDHEVLELLLEAEKAGKHRKTVVKELTDLLS